MSAPSELSKSGYPFELDEDATEVKKDEIDVAGAHFGEVSGCIDPARGRRTEEVATDDHGRISPCRYSPGSRITAFGRSGWASPC